MTAFRNRDRDNDDLLADLRGRSTDELMAALRAKKLTAAGDTDPLDVDPAKPANKLDEREAEVSLDVESRSPDRNFKSRSNIVPDGGGTVGDFIV